MFDPLRSAPISRKGFITLPIGRRFNESSPDASAEILLPAEIPKSESGSLYQNYRHLNVLLVFVIPLRHDHRHGSSPSSSSILTP